MFDWLIIGGGIHGTHLSFVLTKRYGLPHDRVRVLDPYPQPLTLWDSMTANVGMTFLRSPLVHHLHYDQGALGVYARIYQKEAYTRFIPPYSRPSLELFRRYSRYLIERYKLDTLRIVGRAAALSRLRDGWRVETADGGIEARHVVLAIGMSEQPNWPAWSHDRTAANAPIHHIFDQRFDRAALQISDGAQVVVVGGGITAAQTALTFAATSSAEVTLLMRHDPRVHDFDSDPGWMNAIHLRDYATITSPDVRRQVIRQARHRGSMPLDVANDLARAVQQGKIALLKTAPVNASFQDKQITLHLDSGADIRADHVVLATGYDQQRPGGQWVTELIAHYDLPVAACGYPVVDESLCWSKGLYVSGPLAELEIGPPSRNIIGARLAGQRLRAAVQ